MHQWWSLKFCLVAPHICHVCLVQSPHEVHVYPHLFHRCVYMSSIKEILCSLKTLTLHGHFNTPLLLHTHSNVHENLVGVPSTAILGKDIPLQNLSQFSKRQRHLVGA